MRGCGNVTHWLTLHKLLYYYCQSDSMRVSLQPCQVPFASCTLDYMIIVFELFFNWVLGVCGERELCIEAYFSHNITHLCINVMWVWESPKHYASSIMGFPTIRVFLA